MPNPITNPIKEYSNIFVAISRLLLKNKRIIPAKKASKLIKANTIPIATKLSLIILFLIWHGVKTRSNSNYKDSRNNDAWNYNHHDGRFFSFFICKEHYETKYNYNNTYYNYSK